MITPVVLWLRSSCLLSKELPHSAPCAQHQDPWRMWREARNLRASEPRERESFKHRPRTRALAGGPRPLPASWPSAPPRLIPGSRHLGLGCRAWFASAIISMERTWTPNGAVSWRPGAPCTPQMQATPTPHHLRIHTKVPYPTTPHTPSPGHPTSCPCSWSLRVENSESRSTPPSPPPSNPTSCQTVRILFPKHSLGPPLCFHSTASALLRALSLLPGPRPGLQDPPALGPTSPRGLHTASERHSSRRSLTPLLTPEAPVLPTRPGEAPHSGSQPASVGSGLGPYPALWNPNPHAPLPGLHPALSLCSPVPSSQKALPPSSAGKCLGILQGLTQTSSPGGALASPTPSPPPPPPPSESISALLSSFFVSKR